MLPIGRAVYLWRTERRLTQEQLARAAGISRPNLSDLERGKRELSLKSLRSLASALQITPGTLVDGIPPLALQGPLRFSRQELDQIADAVFSKRENRRSSRRGRRTAQNPLPKPDSGASPCAASPFRKTAGECGVAAFQIGDFRGNGAVAASKGGGPGTAKTGFGCDLLKPINFSAVSRRNWMNP